MIIRVANDTAVVSRRERHISCVLCGQDGQHLFYKAKAVTKMGKLFDAYAKSSRKDPRNLRFLQNGKLILDDDTPPMVRK